MVLEQGELVVVYGPERRRWQQYSATPGTPKHQVLEHRLGVLQAWLRTGAVPAPPEPGSALPKPSRWFAVRSLAASAAVLGFLWLTLVMPSTSDAGRAARRFVNHVFDRDFDAAHALLSARLRQSIPPGGLDASLPPQLKAATGFSVNAIGSGSGVVSGYSHCVDGYLEGVEGFSLYAFELVTEDGELRVDAWHAGQCSGPR